MASITVYLPKGDTALKDMLKELSESKADDNPYNGLSESKIAGRILAKHLPIEHKQIVDK